VALDPQRGAVLVVAEAVPGVAVDLLFQAALDHLERQEVLSLLAQHPAQSLDIVVVELAVARRRPLRVHQALALEEPDLRDGDIGEFLTEQRQDLTDRKVRPAAHLVVP